MKNWKLETCETCKFRCGESCRKNPPTFYIGITFSGSNSYYPTVEKNYKFKPACSYWKKDRFFHFYKKRSV